MLAQESAAYGRNMLRFAADQLEEGVAQAQVYQDQNPSQGERAALVYDGFITLPSGRTDALIVLVRSYARPSTTLTIAVPYHNANSPDGFAVHRPKYMAGAGHGGLQSAGRCLLSRGRVPRSGGAGMGTAQR